MPTLGGIRLRVLATPARFHHPGTVYLGKPLDTRTDGQCGGYKTTILSHRCGTVSHMVAQIQARKGRGTAPPLPGGRQGQNIGRGRPVRLNKV